MNPTAQLLNYKRKRFIDLTPVLIFSKGRCIGEPEFCGTGISMIFWLKFEQELEGTKYILSSGGSDYRSKGFSFYYENQEFVLKVASYSQVWKAFIPNQEIPKDSWFSFAFTWSEGMNFSGVSIFNLIS